MNLTRRFGSGRGRLSLRSRLLAGLITVTALFLIIMGVVTTVVLGNSEQAQFNSDLRLTARDTTSDTIRGLTLGGDDYVTKPFSVEALVARVRAVLRRTTRAPGGDGAVEDAAMLTVGDLELDEEHWVVRRGGTQVELSPTEFRLLAYLMRNQGRMLTRQQLLENVWGWEFAGQSQVVETYVSYLRRKLDPLGPPLIHTQRGVGYSLRPPPEIERAGR